MSLTSYIRKGLDLLQSRISRNIIFWGVLYYIQTSDLPAQLSYPLATYLLLNIGSLLIPAAMLYVNNLILLPLLLGRKRNIAYLFSAAVVIFATAYGYTVAMKWALAHYPLMQQLDISFMEFEIGKSWAFDDVLNEMNQMPLGIFFIWTCGFNMAWYIMQYNRKEKALTELKSRQMESELHFLKHQLNPHFLFNTMNNLYGLALKQSGDTPDAILRISSILRYLLYESDAPRIDFEKEKEVILAYIELELLRLTDTENLNFQVEADSGYSIPPLLWLPVLENVFKHGTRSMEDNHTVDFRFVVEDGVLTIYSRTGQAPVQPSTAAGGIGLQNLRKKLMLLYPGAHTFSSGPQGEYYVTEVQVTLDKNAIHEGSNNGRSAAGAGYSGALREADTWSAAGREV